MDMDLVDSYEGYHIWASPSVRASPSLLELGYTKVNSLRSKPLEDETLETLERVDKKLYVGEYLRSNKGLYVRITRMIMSNWWFILRVLSKPR
jgi:hypothetical protein